MQSGNYTLRHRIADGITMFVVMWVSLLCLIYVAFGEASRTYERFQGDKLAGQVQIVQNSMETFLRSGLPLNQFVGFNTLAERILASDSSISSLAVYDLSGSVEFSSGNEALVADLPAPGFLVGSDRKVSGEKAPITIRTGYQLETLTDHYRIAVPLRDKFEMVGGLTITMPTAAVKDFVWTRFEKILSYSLAPAIFFAMLIALFGRTLQGSRVPWPQISFSIIFVASASFVVVTLISLYSQGAQTKAQALAESLGQRLSDLVQFNLNINEIEGLDRTFSEYLQVNPDLSSAALTVDGKTIIHTDPAQIGKTWKRDEQNYQYVVDLTSASDPRDVNVAVELPSNVVFAEIVRSVKNFGALFIASAFLAHLFFQVGGNVRRSSEHSMTGAENRRPQEGLVDYVKPVFFLGVLAEHLTYAFLPQHVKAVAAASAIPESLSTAPFLIFYALFAITLIPAGYVAQRISPRPLMYLGLVLAGCGMAGMAFAEDFWLLVASRGLSGVGQGMLFIGVQSYLLAVSSSDNKTQAAAVIVYGFQGGMISGMAVGSLLVGSMGQEGVFALGSLIVLVAALYSIATVPPLTREALARLSANATGNPLRRVGRALCDSEFINAMVSIGMPAKAVLTGVVSFALPLLLAHSQYAQEDIGQIIMVYALAVVASSQFIAPVVDRVGNARLVLFKGTVLSGLGLLLAGYIGLNEDVFAAVYGSALTTGVLVLGIAMVGVAHGFINAPVVTFVANSKFAQEIGAGTATSTYRFLERIGHVAGPLLVGQLFLIFSDDWSAVAVIGAAIIFLGLVFIASSRGATGNGTQDEPSSVPAV